MLLAYTVLLLAGLPFAAGSIYPTQPIQATVWSADQPTLVSWIDDGTYPTLNETGQVDIWLWRDTHTCLLRLAEAVDPTAKTVGVTVPGTVLQPGSKYTLRFLMNEPINTAIYSADFTILPANTTGVGIMMQANGTVGTSTTTVSMTMTTTTTTHATPLGTPPPSGTIQGGGPTQQHQAVNSGLRRVDVEKLKFRFVFVIWPVLMGITMAL